MERTMRRIAVLTSGGDAPGMNAAIRAAVRCGIAAGAEMWGVRNGYAGLMAGDMAPLDLRTVGGIINRGGTMLGTSRPPEMYEEPGQRLAVAHLNERDIEGLVVIGGNGSQSGSLALHRLGVSVVGVASTIDNDLAVVDTSIGVDTALNTAVGAVDRLRDTASSHHRAFVVEVMGRHSGYLATMIALASGAEQVLIPEMPTTTQAVLDRIREAYAAGKPHCIIIAAEGSPLPAATLHEEIRHQHAGVYETRLVVLGHVQRGGAPTVFDRLLGTRLGAAAVDALIAGERAILAGLAGGAIRHIPLGDAIQPCIKVDERLYRLGETLAQ
jgi:6-phosphofructokinase 1